jgi:gamma-glutamyltranspeptidase
MPAAVIKELEARGHNVKVRAPAGATQAIVFDLAGKLIGASEPRVPGKAAGF